MNAYTFVMLENKGKLLEDMDDIFEIADSVKVEVEARERKVKGGKDDLQSCVIGKQTDTD